MMSRKASLELSVNMIVVMIISLILIGIGMFFMTKGQDAWKSGYATIQAIHEKQIKETMARSGQLGMVYPNSITLLRGEDYTFTLGVNNEVGEDADFWILVVPVPPVNIENKVTYVRQPALRIRNNEIGFWPINILTDKAQGKLSYIFNICVFNSSVNPNAADCREEGRYGDIQKIIINVK